MNSLEKISNARAMLESTRDLAELKSIRDTAVAAETYAKAKRLGTEAVSYAQEIINRAERRIGEILAEIPREPGRPGIGTQEVPIPTARQQLGKKLSARSQQIASLDDVTFERNVAKPVTRLARIARDLRARNRPVPPMSEEILFDLRHGDFRDVLADVTVDAVITDPPYGHEFLDLLPDLAAWADKVLTEDGVLAILMGHMYLPEVYRLLDGYRPYRWTACWLAEGMAAVCHARRVHTNWKPILIYGGGPRFSDVIRSPKPSSQEFHRWQQNIDGFRDLIGKLTEPGQTVADPFAGSGTTLIAARQLGRHAIGAEIDVPG